MYTKPFFIWQFIKLLIFMSSFIVDIALMSPDFGFETDETFYITGAIITRTICCIYMLDFIQHEIREFR